MLISQISNNNEKKITIKNIDKIKIKSLNLKEKNADNWLIK